MTEIIDFHKPVDNVDILEGVKRLIEQKFFAIFGPDADFDDLIIAIEDSPAGDSSKRAHCQYYGRAFWVNLPG